MRYLHYLLCLGLIGLGGCANSEREQVHDDPKAPAPAPLIPPEQLTPALVALSEQIQLQVNQSSRVLEDLFPNNTVRRQTLNWRLRIADICRQARARDNAMAGLIELWYWTLVNENFFTNGSAKDQFGEHQSLVIERAAKLVATAEHIVRRAVPPDRFDELKRTVLASAAQGEAYLAGNSNDINPIGNLLEVTRLEGVLNLALSPFNAFDGVKEGGDAVARLSVTADRAVDLLGEYPQILNWHMQIAALELQGQDSIQVLLTEIKRTNTSIEAALALMRELPAQVRTEGVALLDQSRPAQADVRETLHSLTEAAIALERLNTGVNQLIERCTPAETSPTETTTEGRPFDIREYTAALNATALAARDLQQTITTTGQLIASPAIPDRLAEADRAANRLITSIGIWCLAIIVALTASIIVAVRVLRK